MRVYVTPGGKTATLSDDFLDKPKEEFNFDLAVILSSIELKDKIIKSCINHSVVVVEMLNPYYGDSDIEPVVRRLVKAILLFTGGNIDNVIVNTSGGTEKMALIVREVAQVMGVKYPISHVFGIYNKTLQEVIFTQLPKLDTVDILTSSIEDVEEELRLRKEIDFVKNMDKHKE